MNLEQALQSHRKAFTDNGSGQWGGKLSNGEEMWWSEPDPKLSENAGLSAWPRRFARFRFWLDGRHYWIDRYFKLFLNSKKKVLPQNHSHLKILDYGCGAGGTTLSFAMYWNRPICGVDLFPTQLKIAEGFAKILLPSRLKAQTEFKTLIGGKSIQADDASQDLLMSLDVLGHVPNIPEVLNEFNRVLKPDGYAIIFTEASPSANDHSKYAELSRQGLDLVAMVEEHISLFPRETLEVFFKQVGFEIVDRRSANVFHAFFFPGDYVKLLDLNTEAARAAKRKYFVFYKLCKFWAKLSKILPFYPKSLIALRLVLMLLMGRKAYGGAYFYFLKKSANRL